MKGREDALFYPTGSSARLRLLKQRSHGGGGEKRKREEKKTA